jgi:hypothetical protein
MDTLLWACEWQQSFTTASQGRRAQRGAGCPLGVGTRRGGTIGGPGDTPNDG